MPSSLLSLPVPSQPIPLVSLQLAQATSLLMAPTYPSIKLPCSTIFLSVLFPLAFLQASIPPTSSLAKAASPVLSKPASGIQPFTATTALAGLIVAMALSTQASTTSETMLNHVLSMVALAPVSAAPTMLLFIFATITITNFLFPAGMTAIRLRLLLVLALIIMATDGWFLVNNSPAITGMSSSKPIIARFLSWRKVVVGMYSDGASGGIWVGA